jgi:hypothetical protein
MEQKKLADERASFGRVSVEGSCSTGVSGWQVSARGAGNCVGSGCTSVYAALLSEI